VIPSGRFPRDFALGPDGSVLLVTNYASAELQAVDVRTVP
jgi:6-phosphogluconolactonase (cycloisomerase 2 family)